MSAVSNHMDMEICLECLNHRYLFWLEEREGRSGTIYTVPLIRACDACNRDCQLPPPLYVRDAARPVSVDKDKCAAFGSSTCAVQHVLCRKV